MELIVAVYDDWGIGCCGTQPVALSADRKFFRENTKGAMVIVGRRTLGDFPGGKPLPNRINVVLTRGNVDMEGVTVCHKNFGDGVIVWIDKLRKYIRVKFSAGEKNFVMESAFSQGFLSLK